MAKLNTKTSIVDYLKSQGKDSSFSARKKLAQQYGIKNYTGSYNQNVSLLNYLRNSGTSKVNTTKAATSAPKTTSAPKVVNTQNVQQTQTPQQSAIQQQNQDLERAMQEYRDFLRQASDAHYSEQKAMLDSALAERLTELEKAYTRAVQEGEMSQEEADKMFQENVQQIQEQSYYDSQAIELSGVERGIQNSQQMIALEQGQQRHTQQIMQEARSERDERINQIRDRISQIQLEYDLDRSNVQSQYDASLAQARAQSSMMYAQGMSNMNLEQFRQALQTKNQLTLLEQEQLNMIERMEKQYELDVSKLNIEQAYALERMAQEHKYTLSQMKTQHGYDLEKMSKQFNYDVQKMAKQFGYESALQSQAHSQRMAQLSQQYKNSISEQNLRYKQELEAAYRAYHDKNSPEYKIRVAQIEEANQNAINKLHTQYVYNALAEQIEPGTYAWNKFVSDPQYAIKNAPTFGRTGLKGYTEIRPR